MRIIGFVVAIAVMTAAPARAEWKEYLYPELAVRKDFPSEPKAEMGTYKTALVPEAPARILTAREKDTIYKMTVVSLPEHSAAGEGASVLGECSHNVVLASKKVLSDTAIDIGGGQTRVFGRWLSADLNDGSRALTACFFTNERLYVLEGKVLPTAEDFPKSPDAFRFVVTLDFNMDPERDRPRPGFVLQPPPPRKN